ncbi:MAG TPA: hypothetical protein DCG49_07105 [Ruminococcus sp.]|nr:hypothetical protein [Ruminococcus sp.]
MILEIVLSIVIILALLLLIGIPLETILSILAIVLVGLIALTAILFIAFFLFTDISLLFRKKVSGIFRYVDEEGRYDRAVYEVDGNKYTCLFPAETLGRSRIYKENTSYMLLISKNEKNTNAYDRHSLFIIAIGSVVSVCFAVLLFFGIQFLRTLF